MKRQSIEASNSPPKTAKEHFLIRHTVKLSKVKVRQLVGQKILTMSHYFP